VPGSGGLSGQDPPITAPEGSPFNGMVVSFTDADGNTNPNLYTATITWGDGTPTSPGTIVGNGTNTFQVAGTHTYAEAGSFTINVAVTDQDTSNINIPASATVSDAALSWAAGSPTFTWTASSPPAPTLTTPPNQTSAEGSTVSLAITASDPNGYPLTYDAVNLPAGLSINPTTGLISGTIAAGAAATGSFAVAVSVSDGTAATGQSFTWTVNPKVSLTLPDTQSNAEGEAVALQLQATDPGGTLSYTATGLPPGLALNASTGLISGTVAAGAAASSSYAVTVTAGDGTYSASQTFDWAVTHTNTGTLLLTVPGAQANVVGENVALAVQARDSDGEALTYAADGLPDGLSIDPASGVISGTVATDAADPTPYTVTVTVDDGYGPAPSQTFTWVVTDAPLKTQGVPVSAVEGTDTGIVTVATFTTPALNFQAGDFTATVDWGDGTSDLVTMTGGNGISTVSNDHTYAEPQGQGGPGHFRRGAQRPGPQRAVAAGRGGRPGPFDQDAPEVPGGRPGGGRRLRGESLRRPQPALWHPRARHGGRPQRPVPGQGPTLRRGLPDLQRLRPGPHPAGRHSVVQTGGKV
jgi:hypothetical protein